MSPARSCLPLRALAVLGAVASSSVAAAQAPTWPALDSAVTAELARTRTPGAQVAVVVNGRLAYSKGYGVADVETGRPVTEHMLFRVGSLTKMVTAATLTQLAADGKLDLQAPIARYVTELQGRKVGTVTTHQLLTHGAGWLDNAVAYGRMGEGALGEVMREVGDTLFITPRAPCDISVVVESEHRSVTARLANLSGGGAFVALAHPHAVHTVLTLRFTLREQPCTVQARVAWRTGPSSAPWQDRGMGVEFVGSGEAERALLRRCVAEQIHRFRL